MIRRLVAHLLLKAIEVLEEVWPEKPRADQILKQRREAKRKEAMNNLIQENREYLDGRIEDLTYSRPRPRTLFGSHEELVGFEASGGLEKLLKQIREEK